MAFLGDEVRCVKNDYLFGDFKVGDRAIVIGHSDTVEGSIQVRWLGPRFHDWRDRSRIEYLYIDEYEVVK